VTRPGVGERQEPRGIPVQPAPPVATNQRGAGSLRVGRRSERLAEASICLARLVCPNERENNGSR